MKQTILNDDSNNSIGAISDSSSLFELLYSYN